MTDNRKFMVEMTMDEIKEIVFCDSLSQSTRENFFIAFSNSPTGMPTANANDRIRIYVNNNEDDVVYINKETHLQIKGFILQGEWIQAIKLLRVETNCLLVEAKNAIDIFAQKNDWPYYKDYLKPYSKGF